MKTINLKYLGLTKALNNAVQIYRGFYMSAHVLLNLLNELGEMIRYEDLPSIWSVSPNEFYKFNNTGARMQDSIYHMTLKPHFISKFCIKTSRFQTLENATFLWMCYDVICIFNQLVDYRL